MATPLGPLACLKLVPFEAAASIAAVDQNRRRNPRPALPEDIERRDRRVELATSMVGKDHPIGAG